MVLLFSSEFEFSELLFQRHRETLSKLTFDTMEELTVSI